MHTISLQKLEIINEIIECGSANKAALQLGISPSLVSYTIRTLKEKLGSNIFTRTSRGLMPNEIAFTLQETYRNLIALNQCQKEYYIATYSLIELLLTEAIQSRDDNTLLHFRTMDDTEEERLKKLKRRAIDIDIGGKLPDDISIISQKYLQSDMRVLVSENHSSIGDVFTISDWLNNSHLRWRRDEGSITSMVKGMDLTDEMIAHRDISWESPNLLTMAYLCSRGDSIMLIPEVFVSQLKRTFPLKALALPQELEMSFECYIHYHRSLKIEVNNIDLNFM